MTSVEALDFPPGVMVPASVLGVGSKPLAWTGSWNFKNRSSVTMSAWHSPIIIMLFDFLHNYSVSVQSVGGHGLTLQFQFLLNSVQDKTVALMERIIFFSYTFYIFFVSFLFRCLSTYIFPYFPKLK